MNINRHNYEEYFLLYIDNELNVDQQKQVEAFVLANPDLEEELVMLQQSRLVPDDSIVFEGKEMLMKKEEGPITIDNYEQWLVMYVDNELTEEERIAVEKFADSTPTVRAELNLFLQTKLEPQKEIVFPDKESLYRTEVKVRVISMRWLRVAAVIAVLLASAFGIYTVVSTNNSGQKVTAKNNTTVPNNSSKSNTVEPGNQTATKTQDENENKNNVVSPATQDQQQPVLAQQKQNQKASVTQQLNTPQDKINVQQQPQQEQTLAKLEPSEINGTSGSEATKTEPTKIDAKTIESNNNASNAVVANLNPAQQQNVNDSHVTNQGDQTLHNKEAETPTDEVVESSGNKKVRGIFRRATRFIERTTKLNPANADGKVLIGAVAVSLK